MTYDELTLDTEGMTLDAEMTAPANFQRKTYTPVAATPVAKAQAVPARQQVRSANEAKCNLPPLYFDFETIPDYSRMGLFNLPDVPPVPAETDEKKLPDIDKLIAGTVVQIKEALRSIVAPPAWLDRLAKTEAANKDRDGVHEQIAAARGVRKSAEQAHADRRKLLSTTPEYCSIAAMGFAIGDNEVSAFVTKPIGPNAPEIEGDNIATDTERGILEFFWRLVADGRPVCVFNGLYFDLPVLLVRSAILGVAPSRRFDLRPWGADVIDPYIGRFGSRGNTDKERPGKLKTLAALYGIPIPAGDMEGSQVEECYHNDPAKVGRYVISDVELLRTFHQTLSGFFWS